MLLAQLVELVGRIRGTARKTEKVALIAEALGPSRGHDTELLALYLTGTLPQGRIGLGWHGIEAAMTDRTAEGPPLTLDEIDQAMGALATEKGAGSAERRTKALRALFERADEPQRRFLTELLMG